MGTYPFCRTKEAVKRMHDDDVIQRIATDDYYKIEHGLLKISSNLVHWDLCPHSIESLPPYEDWRSLSNLHYYEDFKTDKSIKVKYLTADDCIVSETNPLADKSKKRWFLEDLWS